MVLKRRDRRTPVNALSEFFYPKGGWRRAGSYVMHRLRRLPDPPHRIARGVAAGVFMSFTPLFGLHLLGAAALAWAMRGNILAALLGTFAGNPLTTPLIMAVSVEVGTWMLDRQSGMQLPQILSAFGYASVELWYNFMAIFTASTMHWDSLIVFFDRVFWPYMIGGIAPGVVAAVISYYLTLPVIGAYQKLRTKRLMDRVEKRREAMAERRAAQETAEPAATRKE